MSGNVRISAGRNEEGQNDEVGRQNVEDGFDEQRFDG